MPKDSATHPLFGRTLYIPRMSTGAARCMAAAFCSVGVDARVSPPSDDETMRLAARFTTGEECLPQRVVLGNFLKIALNDGFDPKKNAFLLPTSSGPCRFGQYATFIRKVLDEIGCQKALVFSPTSSDGYAGFSGGATQFLRTAWIAIVASDALRKLLLMHRPYASNPDDADSIHKAALDHVCSILAQGVCPVRRKSRAVAGALEQARDLYNTLSLKEEPGSRPLIGVVGEIYLRFNSFSNQDILRRIEAAGGETWIASIAEWVWYTNAEEIRKLKEAGRQWSADMLKTLLRHKVQHHDENMILAPLSETFRHRFDASVSEVLRLSQSYLPQRMALGEMTLNAGNALAFERRGCDGIVDISPFTCMNAIVTEAVYPVISADAGRFPIRIFYFDGVPFDLDCDLEIFIEQVKSHQKRRSDKDD